MDKVKLNRIELWGSIGVLEMEKAGRQRYWVSIEIETDLRTAGVSDHLSDTIDYASVFQLCDSLMKESTCELLESYAEALAQRLFQQFEIAEAVTIEVLKPDAPIEGRFESVGIEIARTRHG